MSVDSSPNEEIRIVSLKEMAEYRQALIDYVERNWKPVFKAFSQVVAACLSGKGALPQCHMMLKDKRIVGFYQLIEHELIERKDLSPGLHVCLLTSRSEDTV